MYIETFVFFDIETTGLPHQENNRTKITELSLVAVLRRDIEITSLGYTPCVSKLSLVFNPQKKIQAESEKITGLSNTLLQNQPIFKERIHSINSFLESLTKPICLVAHNGNIFDYKILRAEYIDAKQELPTYIYCVDSLLGFRKILKDTNLCFDHLNTSSGDCITDDEDDEWPALNTSKEEWQEIDQLVESISNTNIKPNVSSTQGIINNKSERVNYSLAELYRRLTNKDPHGAHRAEADCIMLLECVVAAKAYFLHWADKQCKLINDIIPLKRKF